MKKLLIALLILGISSTCFAGEPTSYIKVKWLGINPKVNPRLLGDDESPDASNITLYQTGAIQDRDVFSQYNSLSGALGNNAITGLFKYYTTTSKYFIACAGSKVALGSGGAFTTDISPTANTVTAGKFWSAATFNNYEYMFNPSIPMQKYDTVKSALYTPASYPTTNCAFGTPHKARIWAARADTTPYRLYWCSLNNGDDWTTTGGYLNLPDLSKEITGIVSWGGYLFIYTETDIYKLLGSTPNDFSLIKTNSTVGSISPRSIRISDIGIISLARTGVFAFDGNTSHKLSDKVEPLINNISKTQIQNACGIYDGQNRYWLSYTEQGASYNNKILIYDTILKEWYPYNNLNINYFERAYGGTDKGELYGGSSTTNGIVYQMQSNIGAENITHFTKTDFDNGVTFNTVVASDPVVVLQRGGYDDYTKLLAHFDGTNGGTYTPAETGQTISYNGTAQLSTAIKKFGTASLLGNGSSDWVTVPDSDDWNFADGNFTIDMWVNLGNIGSNQYIFSHNTSGDDFSELYWLSTRKWAWRFYSSGIKYVEINATDASVVANTWYHIAVVRNENTYTFYRDGVSKGTATSAQTYPDFTNVNGKKSVILMHGIFWHLWIKQKHSPSLTKDMVETDDKNFYKTYGWDCLIIWEDELKETERVKVKIAEFAGVVV